MKKAIIVAYNAIANDKKMPLTKKKDMITSFFDRKDFDDTIKQQINERCQKVKTQKELEIFLLGLISTCES